MKTVAKAVLFGALGAALLLGFKKAAEVRGMKLPLIG